MSSISRNDKPTPPEECPGAVSAMAHRIEAIAEQQRLRHRMEIFGARMADGRDAWVFELTVVAPSETEAKRMRNYR